LIFQAEKSSGAPGGADRILKRLKEPIFHGNLNSGNWRFLGLAASYFENKCSAAEQIMKAGWQVFPR
jgi:hypothetical protein